MSRFVKCPRSRNRSISWWINDRHCPGLAINTTSRINITYPRTFQTSTSAWQRSPAISSAETYREPTSVTAGPVFNFRKTGSPVERMVSGQIVVGEFKLQVKTDCFRDTFGMTNIVPCTGIQYLLRLPLTFKFCSRKPTRCNSNGKQLFEWLPITEIFVFGFRTVSPTMVLVDEWLAFCDYDSIFNFLVRLKNTRWSRKKA